MSNAKNTPIQLPSAATEAGEEGQLPIPSGGYVSVPRPSDWTRTQLEELGWQEGDPVPGDLGQRIAAAREAMQADEVPLADRPELKGWKPVVPTMVSVNELSPEAREFLRDYLSQTKQQARADAAIAEQTTAIERQIPAGAPPEVRAATLAAAQQRLAAEAATPSQPSATSGKPPTVAGASAGHDPSLTHCPRCLWPLSQEFSIKVTESDRDDWAIALLAPRPFQKSVRVMGGRLRLVFRTLTTDEEAVVLEEVYAATRRGELSTNLEQVVFQIDLRLCLGLKEIHPESAAVSQLGRVFPALDAWQASPDGQVAEQPKGVPVPSPLMRFRAWVHQQLVTESLRRVVQREFQKFLRLAELLEQEAASPDF